MSRFPALALFGTALALSTACSSTSVSGEVDGTRATGVRSAIFDTIRISGFGFEFESTVMMLSDIPNGCEAFEEITRVRTADCVDTCTDLGSIGDEFLGRDDYWAAYVVLNPYDDHIGTYAYDSGLQGEGEFTTTFSALDFSEIYNQESCEDECFANNDVISTDDEESDGGTVTIDAYENNVEMQGDFEIDFPGDEQLRGRFKAEHCNLEDLFSGGLL
jgi:hypothetical protein